MQIMGSQSSITRIALLLAVVFCTAGILMMACCSLPFALAAISFGITAAAANGRLRWYAAAFVAASVIASVLVARREAEWNERAIDAAKRADGRQYP